MKRFLLVALTICSLVACRHETPEAKVRAAFASCMVAVEKSDAGTVTDLLAPDFEGPEGMDRGAVRLYLMGVFRQQKVGVSVLANRVQIKRGEAVQAVDLVLIAKGGGLLPEDAGRHGYLIRWREIKGDWKIRSVEKVGPNS